MTNKTDMSDVINTLNGALIELIGKTNDGITFLSSEIPDVISQLLMWHMTISLLSTLLGVILIASFLYALKTYSGKGKLLDETRREYAQTLTHDKDGDMADRVYITAMVFSTGIGGSIFLLDIKWLKILIAPKVYLIEYAAALIK